MADCESVVPVFEGRGYLNASVLITRALEATVNVTDDLRKTLQDLGTQLATITTVHEKEGEEIIEIQERLNVVQETIMRWEADQSMDDVEYLNAADEAQKLTKRLESLCPHNDSEEKELLRRSHDVLQMAMARLEKEFKYMLIQNRKTFEPMHLSFTSSDEDFVNSIVSFGDDSIDDSLCKDSVSGASEEFIIDLIHPYWIPHLRNIANLMLKSSYNHECTNAYIIIGKDASKEYLFYLPVENLSTDDLLRMERSHLNRKMRRWVLAMKKFVRVYLAREKRLSDQIFGEVGSVSLECFVEVSKASMLQILNCGQSMATAPYQPERLFPILDIYEVLADLLPDIDYLYTDEAGSSIRTMCREVLRRVRTSARATILEFKNAITSHSSMIPFPGGGIHHLTRYVINYMKFLSDYTETLNLIIKDHDGEESILPSPETSPAMEDENVNENSLCSFSPLALLFQSIASILESKLHDMSKLFPEASLHHIFLMNNTHYMAGKCENSELRHIIGDEWIRKHIRKFEQHKINYERTTWSSILTLLTPDGGTYSNSVLRTRLKKRLQSFHLGVKEVQKTQKAWVIPDVQLRDDLRLSVSVKVIQAYRAFVNRYGKLIGYKHFKFTVYDRENYLLDLFGGSKD